MKNKKKVIIGQPDRVSYWEDAKINIGDFESRGFGMSVTSDVMGRRFGTISESASTKVKDETINDALDRVIKKVKKKLKKRELKLRRESEKFVEFDTMEKV